MSEEQAEAHQKRIAAFKRLAATAHVVTRDSDGGTKVQHAVAQTDKRKKVGPQSEASMLLTAQLEPLGFVPEYRFANGRRWRFDQALPSMRIAVELEGGVWTQGRHTRPSGFLKDIEKYNAAAIAGYAVIRCTPDQVKSGEALETVRAAIKARSK